MKLPDLLALAEADGRLTSEDLERITNAVAREKTGTMPWYLQCLVAFGAWLSALMLLVFVFGVFHQVLSHAPLVGIMFGLVQIIGAAGLQRVREGSAFFGQAALAISAAGHALALYHVAELADSFGAAVLCALVLAVVVYPLNRSWLHRFLSCLSALLLSSIWIFSRGVRIWGPQHEPPASLLLLSVAVHVVAGAVLLLRPQTRRSWRPLAYAVVISWLLLLLPTVARRAWFDLFTVTVSQRSLQLIVTAALLGAVAWAARGISLREHGLAAALVTAAVLGLGWIAAPPIIAALVLLVAGFGLQDRPLLFIGGLSLPVFLLLYYYNMEWTFRQKSQLLMATGAALLLVQLILNRARRPPLEKPVA